MSPLNLNVLRKTALALCKNADFGRRISIQKKRFAAALYPLRLLEKYVFRIMELELVMKNMSIMIILDYSLLDSHLTTYFSTAQTKNANQYHL